LYYRLNVIELHLPPLRERLDDIADLSAAILRKLAGGDVTLSPAALQALRAYDFPGNVRELENILERALAFANDGCIQVADLALRNQKKLLTEQHVDDVVQPEQIVTEAISKKDEDVFLPYASLLLA
jgi:two-component system response regulator PilR (NtrC family)